MENQNYLSELGSLDLKIQKKIKEIEEIQKPRANVLNFRTFTDRFVPQQQELEELLAKKEEILLSQIQECYSISEKFQHRKKK